MIASFFQDVPFKAKIIGFGIIFIPIVSLVLLGLIFVRAEPIDQRKVWGCYIADAAPPVDIREDAIYIIEPARRKFTYEIYRPRDSYLLRVSPALRLERQAGGRYAFSERRGVGYFWSLRPEIGVNSGKVREAKDYAGRIELEADDATIIYSRVSNNSACHL